MQITLPETVDAENPAAVRAYVDAEVSRRIRAGHLAPGEVSYDIYVDKNGTTGFQADERLGFGADRSTLAWGASARHPLTANIQAMRDDILAAEVTGLDNEDLDPQTPDNQTIPTSSLHDLRYTSDGADGVSQSEAQSLLARFQSLFSNDESGRRQLFEAYRRNPQVRFGPAPRDTVSLQEVYRIAGVPPPDGNSRPTIPGQPGAPTDPNAPDAAGPVLTPSVFNADTSDIDRRIRRLMAAVDELMRKLAAGLIDVTEAHSQFMNLEAQIMNLIGALSTIRTAPQLQAQIDQLRANTDRTSQAFQANGGRPSGQQTADIERSRSDSQLIVQNMQALQRSMQQILDSVTDFSRKADEAVQWRRSVITRSA